MNLVQIIVQAVTEQAENAMHALSNTVKESFAGMVDTFGKTAMEMASGVGIEHVVEHLGETIQEVIERAAEDFARLGSQVERAYFVLGTTPEAISNLKTGLEAVGMGLESFTSLSVRLTRELNRGTEIYDKYGVAVKDVNGELLPTPTIINNIIEKLKEYEIGTNRNAVAQELLKRGFQSATQLMNYTTEIQKEAIKVNEEFGTVMTEQDVKAANEFEHATSFLKTALEGFYIQIGRDLSPALTGLANLLREVLVPVFLVFKYTLATVASGLEGIWNVIYTVIQIFNQLASVVELALRMLDALGLAMMGRVKDALEVGKKAWADYVAYVAASNKKIIDNLSASRDRMKMYWGFAEPPPEEAKGKKAPPPGLDDKNVEDLTRARLALQRARLEAELSIIKEYAREMGEENDVAYKKNTISLQQYYDERLRIELLALDKEIEIKRKELENTKKAETAPNIKEREKLSLQVQEVKQTAELTVLEAKRAYASVENNDKMTAAQKKYLRGLQDIRIESEKQAGTAQVEMARIQYDQAKELNLITNAERIDAERVLQNQLYEIDRAAQEKKMQGLTDPTAVIKAYADLEELERQHQLKLAKIDKDAILERAKYQIQLYDAEKSALETLYTDLGSHTKSLKTIMLDFFNSIYNSINKILAQKFSENLTKGLFGEGTILGGFFNKLIGGPLGAPAAGATGVIGAATGAVGAAAGTAADTAHTAAVTADTTALTANTTAATTASTALTTMGTAATAGGTEITTSSTTTSTGLTALSGIVSSVGSILSAAFSQLSVAATMAASALTSMSATKGAGALSMFLPSFDVGSAYVPHDMVAVVHEGEKIIPKAGNIRSAGDAASGSIINNYFAITGAVDTRTQNQIAAAAGLAVQRAIRRNT